MIVTDMPVERLVPYARNLLRSTNLNTISHAALAALARRHNNTPRKCLGFKTPAEVFQELLQLSHFNRDSTFRPSPE
jgi:hypothetical protein